MRVISRTRLVEFWSRNSRARAPLSHWYAVVRAAQWSSLADVRRTFRHADPVKVASGETVLVFDVGGNNFRLVCAVKYDFKTVYVLRVMSHADYDREKWKEEL